MKVPHLWKTAGTAALCCASIANADIITVTIEGYMQNIDDPTNYFMGGDRWSASIDIDTANAQPNQGGSITQFYDGIASYSLGNRSAVSLAAELQVTDGPDPSDPGITFDILAINVSGIGLSAGGFYALDLNGNVLDSLDLPPLGLTFGDGFTPGVVGTDYENPTNGAFAELVADTVSVTPTPSGTAMLALAGLAASRRRR